MWTADALAPAGAEWGRILSEVPAARVMECSPVAWEARGGGRYYYKVSRDDGRVRRLYQLAELADLLVRAALVAAGYHRHDRGNWRKRRERTGKADRG
jgi:hypothetical protein